MACLASIRLGQAVIAIVLEDRDVLKLEPLVQHFERMDDGGTVGAVLAEPRAAAALGLEEGLAAPEGGGVEPLGLAASGRGNRIVDQHEHDPEQEGDDHRRQHELPHRDSGGAQHDEFGGTAQHQEDADRSDQHGEGKDELGEGRQAQQRHPCEQEARNVTRIVARAA